MISASPTPLETDVTADAEQQRAIDHLEGPCLVLAGPGSGKTRVIVERFIALTRRGFPPEQQLVLTYTNKAAAEMRERAEAAHGPFAGEPPLTTYHAFAYRVVRDWGWLAGTSPAETFSPFSSPTPQSAGCTWPQYSRSCARTPCGTRSARTTSWIRSSR